MARLLRTVLATMVVSVGWAGAASADGPINWSAPIQVMDRGTTSLSCPSASLCVGVGATSTIVHSDEPASGKRWTAETASAAGDPLVLYAVSCPTVSMCAAISRGGRVAVTTDPRSAVPSWTISQADTAMAYGTDEVVLEDIDCPSPSLCVATDDSSNVVTSIDPTAGAPTWTVSHVDSEPDYECVHYGGSGPGCWSSLGAVSCASASHCAAADDGGRLFSSDDPAGGGGTWHTSSFGPQVAFSESLSCPTAALCLGTSGYDQYVWTGIGGDYRESVAPGGENAAAGPVWCPSRRLCIVATDDSDPRSGDGVGELYATTEPSSRRAGWDLGIASLDDLFGSGACASVRLCFAIDTKGQMVVGRPAATKTLISASIAHALTPRGSGGRLAAVRDRDGYAANVAAPDAGRLVVRWYAGRAEVASGQVRFAQPGRQRLRVALHRAGRRLLAAGHAVSITARGAFTPTESATVPVVRRFTLR